MKNLMTALIVLMSSTLFGQTNTTTFENGATKSEYRQENNLVAVTHFYVSGAIKETGFFKDGIPEGKWEAFTESGDKTAELNYADGDRHGEFRVWDEFANTYTEIKYEQGEIVASNKWIKEGSFASDNN